MANRRLDPVTYKRFQAQPLLSDGLLSVSREGGDLERKVALGLSRIADNMGRRADAQATREGERAGAAAGLAGAPTGATYTGGGQVADGGDGSYQIMTGTGIEQAKALLRKEEGFRESPYWDVNAHRVGYGSDTITGADGKSRRVTQGMRITREDAERDLDYRLSAREGAQVRRQLGETFEKLAPGAQAALLSVGYNYGSLPGNVVAAAKSGDIGALASSVAGLSSNPKRRQREAAMIRGGAAAPGQSYSTLPSPASVGPVSVTPVREPVEITPGRAGTFQPRQGDSVYARAYNVAGTRTYLEAADLAMMQNQQAVFEKYQEDPAMLEKALGENLTADLRDNVIDEIAPEYTLAYQKRAAGLVSKARTQQRERQEQQNKLEFIGRVEDLENRKSQQMAGLDASDPSSAGALSDLQSTIDAHWDSAAARGIVSPLEAESIKKKSRSETTVGFYTRQASKMNADEIKAMREEMTRDYADGGIDGVTAEDWDKISTGLVSAEAARKTQDVKATADYQKRADDLIERVAKGLPLSGDELAKFELDAGTTPKGREIATSASTRFRVAQAIRTQPIGEVEKNLKTLLGDGATADDVAFAQKAIASQREDLNTDPLGVAERFGVLPVSPGLPLDGDVDPAAVAGSFAERINASRAAAQHFGVSPKYFRPGEAKAIETAVKADPENGLDIAAGLVSAAGADADRVLAELGAEAPALSLSGGLIAAGGNRQAALDLLAGFGKTADGKAYTDMPNTKRIPVAKDAAGSALAFTPSEVNRLDQAASSIARKRLYDAGIDPKKDDAKEIYERAYQEAAGATFSGDVQYGGFGSYKPARFWSTSGKVLMPPSIRADKFGDLVGALQDSDIGAVKAKNGKTWKASDFQKAMPVAVKGGYAFALGDPSSGSPMFIADETGKAVVLDIAGMKSTLGARVPGAYR